MRSLSLVCALLWCTPVLAAAQDAVVSAVPSSSPHAELSFSPASGTFEEGSTFDVSVFLDTKGASVNAVELHITFDPNVLSIVHPTGGTSIVGLWIEPPSFDNTKGTAKIVGTIPDGINTSSGLITTITFLAKRAGRASVNVSDLSKVLLNDGLGTNTDLQTSRGFYTIMPKPPNGVQIVSDTHPFQDQWYNNNTPVLTWSLDPGVTGFSTLLDTLPASVPPDTVTASSTVASFDNLSDGVWYFHVKPLKRGVWGAPSHFMIRIDTQPPAAFEPTVSYVGSPSLDRFLISFSTTDALSGIDHYEVGVINGAAPPSESPAFVQVESPYQLPFSTVRDGRVIVRAFDKAGNVREEAVDVHVPNLTLKFVADNAMTGLLIMLAVLVLLLAMEHLFDRRIIRRVETELEHVRETSPHEGSVVPSSVSSEHHGTV